MAKLKNFVGQSYYFNNVQYDACRSVNFVVEIDENSTGDDMEIAQLRSRWGKTLAITLPTGTTVRGLYTAPDGTCYAVGGNKAYQITQTFGVFTATEIGTLVTSSGHVSIAASGGTAGGGSTGAFQTVVFCDNPNGYYYALGQVTSLSVDVGGTGYAIGDFLTLAAIGTTGVNFLCQVASIGAGGAITGLTILWGGNGYTAGSYTGLQLQYYSGTGGTGAYANLTVSATNFAQIQDATFLQQGGASFVTTLDGYFNFISPNSTQWMNSSPPINGVAQLLPFNIGSGLFGFANNKTGNSDPINGMFVTNRQLWLLGTQTSEIWVDQSTATSAYQRLNGPYIEQGCYSPFSVSISEVSGSAVGFWVSQSPRGGAQVWMSNGLGSTKISTQVVDQQLQKYGTAMSNCTGFAFQRGGHTFYQVNPPAPSASSWVYDFTSSQMMGVPVWTEFTFTTSNGVSGRDLADNYAFFSGYELVGDQNSSNIYFFDDNNFTDNGYSIYKTRIAPHIVDGFGRLSLDMLQIKCQAGVGQSNPPSTNPQTVLQISEDGGLNYGFTLPQPLGPLGDYIQLQRWYAVGTGRNRVIKVTCTDNVQFNIMGADVSVTDYGK